MLGFEPMVEETNELAVQPLIHLATWLMCPATYIYGPFDSMLSE